MPAQCAKSLAILIQTAYQRIVLIPLQKRRTAPTYCTRTITKKGVSYLLAKIEAYRTNIPYRTAILASDLSGLLLTFKIRGKKDSVVLAMAFLSSSH